MAEIGVRELKNRTSEIVRAVREEQVEYVITYRGQPVARLVPVVDADSGERAWHELERLSQEISAQWQSDKSAVELLAEMRR
jgi:prevent-host-death family protein